MTPTDPDVPDSQLAPVETQAVSLADQAVPAPPPPVPQPVETRILLAILLGPNGLRAGWSVVLFALLTAIFSAIAGFVFVTTHLINTDPKAAQQFTATSTLFGELVTVIGIIGAAAIVALIEHRRGNLLAFNLSGPRPVLRFIEGLVAGFLSLSALIGALAWGGWLHFGPIALSGSDVAKYAILWAIAFLLVGCFEEGTFRCYLQFTLTRGINFWWALGIISLTCLKLVIFNSGNGNYGIYVLAALGLIPCLILQLRKSQSAGFWQAAWVTTTLFGFIHTGNGGEDWIGIFAAGAIGFVFVISIRVTGSAWWAIGCHAAWDWAETYFYGAADSGNVAHGHYLTVTPSGNPFWSGGTAGPEGSILVIGIIVLMAIALVLIYGRRKPPTPLQAAN